MAITVNHSTPADGSFSASGASAWDANHTLTGVGTMATQDANAVAITGGTINGTTIGATTASTGAFTYLSTSSSTSITPTLSFNGSNSPYAAGATIAGSYLQHLLQNKSGTAGASTNYVLSNDLGTDSSYYGEFGMNSSVYSAGTPADFFSLNNGIYFSGHDGDITVGSGNGYKTYLAWGTVGQSAHVINATGAIGLNTNITGSTNFGTSGQVLTSAGSSATPTWATPTTGTVTSVALALPSIFSVTGSPVTTSGTLTGALTTQTAATVFAGPATGAAATPTFRAIVATDIPTLNQNTTGSAATLTTPRNIYGNAFDGSAALTQIIASTYGGTGNGFTKFSGATTAEKTYTLPDANATLLYAGGALGTPSSGTVTNLTGTASININGTVGATTATTGAFTTVSATGVITSTLATGTAPFTVASTTQVANLNAATAGTAGNVTGIVLGANGGTGVANTGSTITVAGNLSHAGAFTQTFTATANTALTLPTSGTLISTVTNMAANPVTGTPSSSNYLRGDGTWATVSASAGGSTTQIQYNNAGALAGSANLTFDGTTLTGAFSGAHNGTVGATTPSTVVATQLTVNGANLNTAISPTGTGTVTISPAGALTINPTAASTINNTSIGATTASTGRFTSITATTGTITPATGTASVAPISFTAGTNLTSATAGAFEYDGSSFYSSIAASTRGVMPTEQIVVLNTAYTLTSQIAAQKLFNNTTNGAVTLPIGTYQFECSFTVTSLSSSTGSFGFAFGGAATIGSQAWWAFAIKPTAFTGSNTWQGTYNTAANTTLTIVSAATNGAAVIKGILKITAAGTVIPQISQSTAAAAIVGINSYFKISPITGASAANITVGNWS